MTETELDRIRARTLSEGQLLAEILRLRHGLAIAARPRDASRWQRRLAIFESEAVRRGLPVPVAADLTR